MNELVLYHGSPVVVEAPRLEFGRPHNDYGQGFYCTEQVELAREWACGAEGRGGFANRYRLQAGMLRTLDLSSDEFTALHWLALLLANRVFDAKTPIEVQGKRYLAQHFAVETSDYDVVRGWRADDSYFSFARSFLRNTISYEQLSRAMRLGDLGEQVVLVSPRAFEHLAFEGAEPVAADEYYPKRVARDSRARQLYRDIADELGIDGLYLRDIVQQDVRADDARLR